MPQEVAEEQSRLDGTLDALAIDRDGDGMHREIVRPGAGLGQPT
jgi:hypothetical protein